MEEKKKVLLKEHAAALECNKDEFESEMSKKIEATDPGVRDVTDGKEEDDEEEVEGKKLQSSSIDLSGKTKYSTTLSNNCQVLGQNFMVVSFVLDTTSDVPEFMFYLYGCFGSKRRD